MNKIAAAGVISIIMLSSCSSDNEPDNRVITVSEFKSKVENKIWKSTTAEETTYIKSNGDTYSSKDVRFSGQMFTYAYLFTGDIYTNFSINIYDPDRIYYQRADYSYTLDEQTGEVTIAYPTPDKEKHLFTIESVTDDTLIIRDMYGCLMVGFEPNKWDYTEEEREEDEGSYRRLVLHPLYGEAEKELLEKFVYKN